MNIYLKDELENFHKNKDSGEIYHLRLIDFQRMNENDNPVIRDTITNDVIIK